jgi:hypothetical protein
MAEAGLTGQALEKIGVAISLRERTRKLHDRDGVIYLTGRPADRIALNEEAAAARLIRMRISGNAEPDRADALALLEPLAATAKLTSEGERTLAELRTWSSDQQV